MASTTLQKATTLPPLRVTATGFATNVVEVRGFSKLRKKKKTKKRRGGDYIICSETFSVDGLDWMVLCLPDGDGDEQGYMGAFVELVTEGVAVWAHVSLGLVDWTTGCADAAGAFFSDEDSVLFDAGNGDCCNWGTGKLASWRSDLRGSRRYVRRDCLKIECVVEVCHHRLAFRDPPAAPKFTPRDAAAPVGTLFGSEVSADVLIHVAGAGAGDPIPAHSSVLEAYAPGFLKKHNHSLGSRRRKPETAAAAATAMHVNVDDMPRPAVEALLKFVYTGNLPVVEGLSGDGYRDMFRHLLLAGKRYGMGRLSAICERVLCRCIDVDSAAATLAMAHRHGFVELKDACFRFASDPVNYGFVLKSKGYDELLCSSESCSVERELRAKYLLAAKTLQSQASVTKTSHQKTW